MLFITININDRVIDRIAIHNTGNSKENYWEYELVDPYTGYKLIDETIWHIRSSGYRPLLEKALVLLKKHKTPTTENFSFFEDEIL